MEEKPPSALRRLANKLAVESEPGLTNTQLMVRTLCSPVAANLHRISFRVPQLTRPLL